MLRLDKIVKPWKESAALSDHINLYGFWNKTAFLTKSGDVGMVLSVPGVDYESLDRSEQFLKTSPAKQVASTLRVRRGPSNGVEGQSAKKLVAGAESTTSVRGGEAVILHSISW